MVVVIAVGNHFKVLNYLMDFLAAWEERPISLTPMAYEWCSALSEVAGRLGPERMHTGRQHWSFYLLCSFKDEFPQVVFDCDPSRLDNSPHIRDHPEDPEKYLDFLAPLKVAFRLDLSLISQANLVHTSHHDRVLETAFSSNDDEVIADAACVWVTRPPRPLSSCARYFTKCVGGTRPFSPRLRQVVIHIIENSGIEPPTEDIVHLLNRLNVGVGDLRLSDSVDDLRSDTLWEMLLVEAMRSPAGKKISSHYWHLLDELVSAPDWVGLGYTWIPVERHEEEMRSLEEAEDWEKLEIWMVIVWEVLSSLTEPPLESMEEIGKVTLKLILLRPSALQRFENLREKDYLKRLRAKLEEVCGQARAGILPPEPQQPPYVSVRPPLFLFVLTPSLFSFSQLVLAQSLAPLPFAADDTFN